ncbi:uncharacterized protein LOC127876823 [Dreissena polymorpha]|uniref:uncharacterized protein LOC127876823 n=1 Tax=Dreissena polymorpha TaxID=45954 RepID=UPI0022652E6E|nr:uncharacterized protein LOC127876823 [Dreissena polymorpha]
MHHFIFFILFSVLQDGELLTNSQTGVTGEFILDFILEQTGEDTVNEKTKPHTITRKPVGGKETEKVQKTKQVSSDNSRTRTNDHDSLTYDPCSSKPVDTKKKNEKVFML